VLEKYDALLQEKKNTRKDNEKEAKIWTDPTSLSFFIKTTDTKIKI